MCTETFCIVFTDIVEADIVHLSMDTNASTVYCQLLNSYVVTSADVVCTITYGYSLRNCERFTDSSNATNNQPGINLTIPLSQDVKKDSILQFCYTVFFKYGIATIKIVGNFTSGIDLYSY